MYICIHIYIPIAVSMLSDYRSTNLQIYTSFFGDPCIPTVGAGTAPQHGHPHQATEGSPQKAKKVKDNSTTKKAASEFVIIWLGYVLTRLEE